MTVPPAPFFVPTSSAVLWRFAALVMIGLCAGCGSTPLPVAAALPAALDYPPTRQVEQTDDYFGTQVVDPYRWLEDDNAADTKAWVAAQNTLTFGYLAGIPFRREVLARIKALSNYSRDTAPFAKNGDIYYFRNDGLQNQSSLYVQKGIDGPPELLLDPNTFSTDGTIRLTRFKLSRNGRFAVYGRTAIAGSDWEEFRVFDMTTRTTLPEVLRWSKFAAPAWQGDGFYYSRLPEPAPGTELTVRVLHQKVWYHKVGTPQSADTLVFEDPAHPTWFVEMATTETERFETLTEQDPSRRGPLLSVRDASLGERAFRPVVDRIGDSTYDVVGADGDRLLVQTNHGAPRGKLMRVDPRHAAEADWQTVLPERAETLEKISPAGGKLFAQYLKDVATRIEIYSLDGKPQGSIPLPGPGSASVAPGDADSTQVFYDFTSLNQPPAIFRYDIASGTQRLFREPQVPGFDPSRYESRQVFFASKDGTRIPMFLVYRKGLVQDGHNPTLLYGYGGFNITLNPGFNPGRVAWLEQGGVYALVNLRGGGEYGEAWHEAGMQLKKQNVFDDCIAAAEYLIREKYTSPAFLALQGGSNGGLLVGAVVNQRPDLFKVALPQVGVMDMLRFQKFSVGAAWVPDYGSSDDPVQFKYLLGYSPLHNIRTGGTYPATMISTSDHDDRVVPAHSFKYAATLQARAGKASGPLLIRIATQSGHGASNLAKRLEEQADMYSFIWFTMGVTPRYPHGDERRRKALDDTPTSRMTPKSWIRLAVPLLAIAVLSGCTAVGTLNALTARHSHTLQPDVAYGALPRQKLDIYLPTATAPPGGWPVAVFFYGGSWSHGERGDYRFVGEALAARGIVALVADYRLYPEVRYPDFLIDCAQALTYGLTEATRLGGNPKRVFAMGHSAGGYNAAMLAVDPRWLAATGHAPKELAGWIGLAGPYDFFPTD